MKKNSLILSILTIVLCATLIAGSSFALFTSESKVNVAVTAGTVKVTATASEPELSSTLGNNVTETSASLENNTITLDKIVPGDVVEFDIVIHNESDVTVNYRTALKLISGEKLWGGLEVTIEQEQTEDVPSVFALDGEEETDTVATPYGTMIPGCADITLHVTVTLPVEAGNEYQGESCKFAYVVEAVQGNSDLDTACVYDLESLNAAIRSGKTHLIIVSDFTVDVAQNDSYSAVRVDKDQDAADVVTLDGDCEITSNKFCIWARSGAKVIINGGHYTSTGTSHLVYANSGGVVEINGGVFELTNEGGEQMFNISNGDRGSIIIKGGLFSRNPSTQIASNDKWNNGTGIKIEDGYEVVEKLIDGKTWYEVVPETP